MKKQEILNILENRSEKVLDNTIALICKEEPSNLLNHAFFLKNLRGGVGITSFAGQIVLDDTYFFSLAGYELPSPSDYDYEDKSAMYADEDFIRDYLSDMIEEAINNSSMSLEA